jgi:hypothetical protein
MSKRKSMRNLRLSWGLSGPIFVACYALLLGPLSLRGQGLAILDAVIAAHGAGPIAPITVQMTGAAVRGSKTEPFRLLATEDEAFRIEYGSEGKDTLVVNSKLNFHDNGEKTKIGQAPSGFMQLDLTGLFLVQQLRRRAVQVVASEEWVNFAGARARRIQVSTERTEVRLGALPVPDRMNLYVSDAGLLAGIVRSFYEGRPEHHTVTYLFSDYRKTGDRLLPYRVDMYVKNRKHQTLQVEQYAFDVPAGRELFQPRSSR